MLIDMSRAIDSSALRDTLSSMNRVEAARRLSRVDSDGTSPLHQAALCSRAVAIELLLDHGAPVNLRTHPNRSTALILVAARGKLPSVRLLLARGADATALNAYRESAAIAACDSAEVIRVLTAHGVPLNVATTEHWTPLRLANVCQHPETPLLFFHANAEAQRISQHTLFLSRPATRGGPIRSSRSNNSAVAIDGIVHWVTLSSDGIEVWRLQAPSRPFFAPMDPAFVRSDDDPQRVVAAPALNANFPSSLVAPIEIAPMIVFDSPTSVHYSPERDMGAATLLSDVPLAPNVTASIGYFEVSILERGECGSIAVGLSESPAPANSLPGWHDGSIGFNQRLFDSNGSRWFARACVAGDTIGVGFNFVTRDVFYTINGDFVGVAACLRQGLAPRHAAVGLYSVGERVAVNFGASPFEFDFQAEHVLWERCGGGKVETVPRSMVTLLDIRHTVALDKHTAMLFGNNNDFAYRLTLSSPPRFERVALACTVARESYFVVVEGVVYAMVSDADNTLGWQQLVGDSWQELALDDESPIAAPRVVGSCAVYMGDGLIGVFGGGSEAIEFAKTASEADAQRCEVDDAARLGCHFFDLRRRHWLGIDQVVDVDADLRNSFATIGTDPSAVALERGALVHAGYDGRYTRPGFMLINAERAGDRRVRVRIAAPHIDGVTTCALHNKLRLVALGGNRVAFIGAALDERDSVVELGELRENFSTQQRLARALDAHSFADRTLVCADGGEFEVHSVVCARRCSGFNALPRQRRVLMQRTTSAHLRLLLHYAYTDSLPATTALTDSQTRAFLDDCVAQLAPEHARRLAELLVSVRVSARSTFAEQMSDAFAFAPTDGCDARVLLGDGRCMHVHRAIVTATSDFFRGCFESLLAVPARTEVDLSDANADLVVAAIRFMYTFECNWHDELLSRSVVEMLALACRLGCEPLASECEALLIRQVDASNARWLEGVAESMGRLQLIQQCKQL